MRPLSNSIWAIFQTGLIFGGSVAIDTETMGLKPGRDRLCVVQLSAGDGVCHLVQFPAPTRNVDRSAVYSAPNLTALLADPSVTKLFHFARFDMAMLSRYLGVLCEPVYCTKIASKLARTYTDRHGLKDLCRETPWCRTLEGAAIIRLGWLSIDTRSSALRCQ